MRFYQKAMRNASTILFWSAFVLFFGSFLVNMAVYNQMFQQNGVGSVPPFGSREMLWQLISSALNAWNNSLLPFFGAAILWVLERKLPGVGGAQ